MPFEYFAIGGSLEGITFRSPDRIAPGATITIEMRDVSRPGMHRDPQGREELYTLEPDGILYFANVLMKDGRRLTPAGKHEPSRIKEGHPSYDYRMVGGSHDGGNMAFRVDFEEGFVLGIGMRGPGDRELPGGKKELYKLGADRRFHYEHVITKD